MKRHIGVFRRVAATGILVVVSLAHVAGAVPARATHLILCGQTVPNNTTTQLHSFVAPCVAIGDPLPEAGLIVDGASGTSPATVVDLNGFGVIGTSPNGNACGILVRNSSGVTIKNGSVSGFGRGVCLEDGSGNTIEAVTIAVSSGGAGIYTRNSGSNTIAGNVVLGNLMEGIALWGNSDSNLLDGNTVQGSVSHSPQLTPSRGINIQPHQPWGSPDNNTITNNQVLDNGDDGIRIGASQNGALGAVGPTGNLIEHNLVEGHTDHGILLGGVRLWAFEDAPANANTVRHNTVCGNPGNGISVYSFNNTISANQAGDQGTKHHLGGVGDSCQGNGSVRVQRPDPGSTAGVVAGWDLYDGTSGCGDLLSPPQPNAWTTNTFATRNQTPTPTNPDCIA